MRFISITDRDGFAFVPFGWVSAGRTARKPPGGGVRGGPARGPGLSLSGVRSPPEVPAPSVSTTSPRSRRASRGEREEGRGGSPPREVGREGGEDTRGPSPPRRSFPPFSRTRQRGLVHLGCCRCTGVAGSARGGAPVRGEGGRATGVRPGEDFRPVACPLGQVVSFISWHPSPAMGLGVLWAPRGRDGGSGGPGFGGFGAGCYRGSPAGGGGAAAKGHFPALGPTRLISARGGFPGRPPAGRL